MSGVPARVDSFRRDGLRFDVLDEGPLDGPVVVLLHGFPQLNTCWAGVTGPLHAQGLRTLAPNQRGYSPGARPRGRRPYRTSELVKDVLALIGEAAAGPVHLVGHDWGAAVAWGAAIMHPEALDTLTAVSVPHPGAFIRAMPRGQILDSWYMGAFNLPWLPERLLSDRRIAHRLLGRAGMTPAMVEQFLRDIVAGGALAGGLGWYRALPLANRGLFGVKVQVPTTYVWSDHDAALGRAGAELTADYVTGDYRFDVLEGVTHWIPDERPEELARIILERVSAA